MQTASSSRPGLAWVRVRDSLWFIPSIAVVVSAALAVVAVQVPTPRVESRIAWVWLFGGGAEGARGVLTAIAGGLISVTGTVFSVTIVALQLASSQFTPRLLRSFVADRVNQGVLGVFIGTFTYTLLVLRTIHTTPDGSDTFVPHVAVTIALALLLVSIGALIVFIDHVAQSIRASVILHRETQRTLAHVAVRFPTHLGLPDARGPIAADGASAAEAPFLVRAAQSGYLQAVHGESLWALGADDASGSSEPATIRMELHVGAFAFPGKPIAAVWPAHRGEEIAGAVRRAFVLGPERTPEQDVEFGLVEVADIAVKALSPGVNDPTTAMHCIDRLTEMLAAFAARDPLVPKRTSPDGRVRFVARHSTFDRVVGLAFDQIRHFGASNPTIAKKLLEALGDLASAVGPAARVALGPQAESVVRAARLAIADPSDLAAIERLAQHALAAARGEEASMTAPLDAMG